MVKDDGVLTEAAALNPSASPKPDQAEHGPATPPLPLHSPLGSSHSYEEHRGMCSRICSCFFVEPELEIAFKERRTDSVMFREAAKKEGTVAVADNEILLGRSTRTSFVECGDYKTILLAEHLVPNQQQHCSKSNVKSGREVLLQYAKEADDDAKEIAEAPEWMKGNGNEGSDSRNRIHVGQKTPVLGSSNDLVRTNGNYGFFSTILESYNNHWTLRTSPEDWWYSIIYKIAVSIDKHSTNNTVRKFFVSHEGKKTLTVDVGPSIYGVDYAWFLDQMTRKIGENTRVSEYVDILKADFSTSTDCHVICSEITIMASVQEFFQFRIMLGCGIPAVEMEGNLEDWKHLKDKFHLLRKVLKPIHKYVGLEEKWWDDVNGVFDHLINTFDGKPDTDWWSKIISKEPFGSGGQEYYEGWFITEFLGLRRIENLKDLQNGVITVPMNITDGEVEEQSAFAAGIAGFDVIEGKGKWPIVKAVHGWTLMLDPQSYFRKSLSEWESKVATVA